VIVVPARSPEGDSVAPVSLLFEHAVAKSAITATRANAGLNLHLI
jgi:hypothetical protein